MVKLDRPKCQQARYEVGKRICAKLHINTINTLCKWSSAPFDQKMFIRTVQMYASIFDDDARAADVRGLSGF